MRIQVLFPSSGVQEVVVWTAFTSACHSDLFWARKSQEKLDTQIRPPSSRFLPRMLFVLNQKQACEQGPLSILKGSTFGSLLKDICFAQARLRSSNLHLRPFQITPATCKSPCRERSRLCSQNSHRATTDFFSSGMADHALRLGPYM